jgi:hypothetical protein
MTWGSYSVSNPLPNVNTYLLGNFSLCRSKRTVNIAVGIRGVSFVTLHIVWLARWPQAQNSCS